MNTAHSYSKPKIRFAFVVLGLIATNVVIFFNAFAGDNLTEVISLYGLVPAEFLQGENMHTLFTSMFLHAGIGHLIGNMWFLLMFGPDLENRMGHFKFLFLYVLTGVVGALTHIATAALLGIPVVGASGAISGILGAYVVFFPQFPFIVFIGGWFIYQLMFIGVETMVAYEAHVGGFLAGFFIAMIFRVFMGKENSNRY